MTDYAKWISDRGGIRALARALDHRNHTTVQGWHERGFIPERHRPAVLAIPPVKTELRRVPE